MWPKPPYVTTAPSARWFERIEEQIRLDTIEEARLAMLLSKINRDGFEVLANVELAGVNMRHRLLTDRLAANRRAIASGYAEVEKARDTEARYADGLPYYMRGVTPPEPEVSTREAITKWLGTAIAETRTTIEANRRARIAQARADEKARKLQLIKEARDAKTRERMAQKALTIATRKQGRQLPTIADFTGHRPRAEGHGRGNALGMKAMHVRAYQWAVNEFQRELCARLGSPWCRATLVKVLNGQRLISERGAIVLADAIAKLDQFPRTRFDEYLQMLEEQAA